MLCCAVLCCGCVAARSVFKAKCDAEAMAAARAGIKRIIVRLPWLHTANTQVRGGVPVCLAGHVSHQHLGQAGVCLFCMLLCLCVGAHTLPVCCVPCIPTNPKPKVRTRPCNPGCRLRRCWSRSWCEVQAGPHCLHPPTTPSPPWRHCRAAHWQTTCTAVMPGVCVWVCHVSTAAWMLHASVACVCVCVWGGNVGYVRRRHLVGCCWRPWRAVLYI
jgi:hypothetical protein